MAKAKIDKLLPDTSVIIEGLVSKKIEAGELSPSEIIIAEAAMAELENQANQGRETGYIGLEEVKNLREISSKHKFTLSFAGRRQTETEIKYAKSGWIDNLIRELALEKKATLMTADRVQSLVAEAKGISTIFIEFEKKIRKLKLDDFFDNTTMSVHLKENVTPFAKKGQPGKWEFVQLSKEQLTKEQLQDIAKEIVEETQMRADGFIEHERKGSTIIQLGRFRIVIAKPPLSDGWEITAVRPVKKLKLSDYKLTEKLTNRVSTQAEGILIAGAPGNGKSTFAQALAEHYALQGKIVKTVEAPRDLVVPDEITQYSISHGSAAEIHDLLLLTRPDYSIYDEMRNTEDFRLFSDLRLAGVGMVGVVHGTDPVDAIQRFLGKIELGIVPHVIDTVLFIKNGTVAKVLSLQMEVKVPSGMMEADLARPVVTVTDFETGKLEYEIYSYGEETVVIPVTEGLATSPMKALAAQSIKREFQKYADHVKVDVISESRATVYVPDKDIPRIIGREGKTIEEFEKRLGIGIDVREIGREDSKRASQEGKQEVKFNIFEKDKSVIIEVDNRYADRALDLMVGDEYILTINVGPKGEVKFKKSKKIGKVLSDALRVGEQIRLLI